MKTKKLLSVTLAAALAVTSFASLAVTASAEDYAAGNMGVGTVLQAGDVIRSDDAELWIMEEWRWNWGSHGESEYTLPDTFPTYWVTKWEYNNDDDYDEETGEVLWTYNEYVINISPYYVTGVSLDKTEMTLAQGSTGSVSAKTYPRGTVDEDLAFDTSLTWTSSDPSVATVDGNGNVTAVAPGTATITATSNQVNTISASCTVTVKAMPTAAYAQVGTDYTSDTETDNVASLWKVTVTAGTDSIETLDVKLGAVSSQEGAQSLDTPVITDAEVVLGVVTNLSGSDAEARGFKVVVNGSDIAAVNASN